MTTPDTLTYETILTIIRAWPSEQRFLLVQDVLKTLESVPTPTHARRSTLQQALGLLATDQPPPSDEEVRQWLEERRMQYYKPATPPPIHYPTTAHHHLPHMIPQNMV